MAQPAHHQPARLDAKRTRAEDIETRLRHDILHGLLKPGEKLNLDRLRETHAVGLTPLREAMNRLVATGLVESEAMKGYTVTPISVANLDEVAALRIELEPYALRRAMENGGLEWEADVMGALHRLNRTLRVPGDPASLAEWESANNTFHATMIGRCDMPLLMKMYHQLVALNDRYRHIYLKATPIQREVIDEHTAIANAAIERRADEACALLTGHITRSTTNLRRLIVADLPEVP